MRLWHALVLAAILAISLVPVNAAEQWRVVSAEPTSEKSDRLKLTIRFGSGEAPRILSVKKVEQEGADAATSAEYRLQQLPTDCRMPIVRPDPRIDYRGRIIQPRRDVRYALRVVVVPPCPERRR